MPTLVAAAVLGVAGCCPPPEPQAPTIITIIVPAPLPAPPKPVPAVARVALPDVRGATASEPQGTGSDSLGRDSLEDRRPVAPPGPKTEIAPPAREPPPSPAAPRVTLPEGVVLQLLESGKPFFLRCLKKAAARDPSTVSLKVRVHVELDEQAKVTAAKAETDDPELASCVERAVHWLTFPVTGQLVAVELPLFYRVE